MNTIKKRRSSVALLASSMIGLGAFLIVGGSIIGPFGIPLIILGVATVVGFFTLLTVDLETQDKRASLHHRRNNLGKIAIAKCSSCGNHRYSTHPEGNICYECRSIFSDGEIT